MRHLTRLRFTLRGCDVFSLIDDDGLAVEPFNEFVRVLLNREFASATVKRYMEVVANFLDYLIEAQVFGVGAEWVDVNRAIEAYLPIRVRANGIRVSSNSADPFISWAKPIVENLGLKSVQPNENLTAPINMFLRLSETIARTELERAALTGGDLTSGHYQATIRAVMSSRSLSLHQQRAILQSSMLANVIRSHPSGLPRPRGLAKPKLGMTSQAEVALDFPLNRLRCVLDAANTARDKALWSLLGGSGLRTSEALALRWENIDIKAQKVFVDDPNNLRWGQDLPLSERLRFKGRAVSTTYIFQPLRDAFFAALLQYLQQEYSAVSSHDFVFQDVRNGPGRGRPMIELSDTARNRSFHRAQERAKIATPMGGRYGLHSLRHLYGVYLLNYVPVPGGHGLPIQEVQRLMGHQSKTTTEKYARVKQTLLESKLMFADTQLLSRGDEWHALPRLIAERLHAEANKYENVAAHE